MAPVSPAQTQNQSGSRVGDESGLCNAIGKNARILPGAAPGLKKKAAPRLHDYFTTDRRQFAVLVRRVAQRQERRNLMETEMTWLAVGFLGQALFSARFLVQWMSSERHKRSVVPLAFWYFSIGGGATLLAYAVHRLDPVFIVGQAAGLLIYLRNLQLIYRERRALAIGSTEGPA
jgi:lipid-A-disaccharide synthase-like uncharacterized protein